MNQEIHLYEPDAGDRIRVCVLYGGSWRPLLWFELEKDGSLYLGPRLTKPSVLKRGAAAPKDGALSISYSEGEVVADSAVLKNPKFSFHASGLTHAAGQRLVREPIRGLREQKELCILLFQHPSSREPLSGPVRKRDVCLERYKVDESAPIHGMLFIAPDTCGRPVAMQLAEHQFNLFFHFTGLADGAPNLLLQLVLGHGLRGPWPPATYVLFQAAGTKLENSSGTVP